MKIWLITSIPDQPHNVASHPIVYGGNIIPEVKNPEEYVPGKLRVSAVYNPFSFPQTNTYTISSGSVLGMAAATAALSQGQYGEFPLYVFTTDGIWALRQGSGDILYASQSPVNREVGIVTPAISFRSMMRCCICQSRD